MNQSFVEDAAETAHADSGWISKVTLQTGEGLTAPLRDDLVKVEYWLALQEMQSAVQYARRLTYIWT